MLRGVLPQRPYLDSSPTPPSRPCVPSPLRERQGERGRGCLFGATVHGGHEHNCLESHRVRTSARALVAPSSFYMYNVACLCAAPFVCALYSKKPLLRTVLYKLVRTRLQCTRRVAARRHALTARATGLAWSEDAAEAQAQGKR